MKKLLSALLITMLASGLTPAFAKHSLVKKHSCPAVQEVSSEISAKPIDELVGTYNNKVKVIFSDIDGTIVSMGEEGVQPKVPESAISAVGKLKQAKIPLILVTGRSTNEISAIAKSLCYSDTYLVLFQGGLILDPSGNVLHEDFIGAVDAKNIEKDLVDFRKSAKLNFKFYMVVNGEQYSIEPFVIPYNGKVTTVIKSMGDFEPNFKVAKIEIYEPDIKKAKLLQAHLKRNFPGFRIDLAAKGYCCISSPTATKGNAIRKLALLLGINLKDAAVFGDAENDLSMFKIVNDAGGLSVATGNASELLKKQADYVTLSVYDGGFAKGVDKIIENNKKIDKCSKKVVKTH